MSASGGVVRDDNQKPDHDAGLWAGTHLAEGDFDRAHAALRRGRRRTRKPLRLGGREGRQLLRVGVPVSSPRRHTPRRVDSCIAATGIRGRTSRRRCGAKMRKIRRLMCSRHRSSRPRRDSHHHDSRPHRTRRRHQAAPCTVATDSRRGHTFGRRFIASLSTTRRHILGRRLERPSRQASLLRS